VYDSVSYGMVDNLGRSDEWLGIIWLGSGEARCLWETSTTRVLANFKSIRTPWRQDTYKSAPSRPNIKEIF